MSSAPCRPADFRIPFRPGADRLGLGRTAAQDQKKTAGGEGKRLHGHAGRRTEITHSASEGVRRRMWSGLWVTLLLAILGFLVIYPVLMLLLGALTDTN